jgi:hypothetical protein
MSKFLVALCSLMLTGSAMADVLIVADEFPAMQVLADKLKAEEKIDSKLVAQNAMPADLAGFSAVIVYIHGNLAAPAEAAFIKYAQAGGKLILLHHSISSGKRANKDWFSFLGVSLPQGDVAKGGYKYAEGIDLDLVNLAPEHYITTNKVTYPAQVPWQSAEAGAVEKALPGVELKDTEVYLNHVLTGPRTILMGVKYTDAKTGQTYMQAHAGWIKAAEKGWVIYLMAGHSGRDFENAVYARIVLNAVVYKP